MSALDRIVCGIDATPQSDAALMQVARIAPPSAEVVLAHSFSVSPVNEVELMLGEAWEHEEGRARAMLEDARDWMIESGGIDPGHVEIRLVPGPKAKGLLELVDATGASLLAVGIHSPSRLGGAIRGSVASHALHSASCSVLIARESEAAAFPGHIVCGVDGSPGSQRAVDVTGELCTRLGCTARYVTAEDGRDVVFTEASKQTPTPESLEIEQGKPVDALLSASASADLLVIGSRGLGGARAIGSVGERVAHEASCSVLLVR